jgi:F420-dependent oxidoreductase-like protein
MYISTAGNPTLDTILDRFVAAEEAGFHTAWAGHIFDWDSLSLLAFAGRKTVRIELGSWVVPTFPRHPVALAQQALTVQSATGGRLALGIGASHAAVIQKRMGIDYARPLRHMKEYLAVLPNLLAGERVQHRGEDFRIAAQLAPCGATPPPVLLAALGPRMLELAGRCAAGVAIWLGGARFVGDFALARIDAGAKEAGRARPRVLVGLPIAVTRDPSARDAANKFLAMSSKLPAYQRVLEREGAKSPGEVALIGDEDDVLRRLEDLAALGVTDFNPILFSVKSDPDTEARTSDVLAAFNQGRG